jgi:hypothetical protein
MLTIDSLSDGHLTTLVLTGCITEEEVFSLESSWRKCCGAVQVDLCDVKEIAPAGKELLARMFAAGVGLVVAAHPTV